MRGTERVNSLADLRVLHVTEVLIGGIATYLNELLPAQIAHYGAENLTVLCPELEVKYLDAHIANQIQIVTYKKTGRNLRSLKNLISSLRHELLTTKPSLVHAHSSFAGLISRLPFVVPSKKLIYTPNGWAFSIPETPFMSWLYGLIERALAKRVGAIIAVSEHERQSALGVGIPENKISVIHSGLSTVRMNNNPSKTDDDHSTIELLFVGRLDEQKGLSWLLKIMRGLPVERFNLTVAGTTNQETSNNAANSLTNIRYLGWVTQQELDRVLDQSDALIMPSRWEAFGFSAAEAMRRGKAVIASNRGALPELVIDGYTGMTFDLDAPDIICSRLLSLTPALLSAWGEAGRNRFLSNFTADQMNQKTCALYDRQAGQLR